MQTETQQLMNYLHELSITTTLYTHEPLHTVEQAGPVYNALHIPGAHCKNLFLKDSKKRYYLISALADTVIELKKLRKAIKAPELRFADEQALYALLQVKPGSVTPFGLINDREHAVTVLLDQRLFSKKLLTFHPLRNDATLTITPDDLKKFVISCGNPYVLYDLIACTQSL